MRRLLSLLSILLPTVVCAQQPFDFPPGTPPSSMCPVQQSGTEQTVTLRWMSNDPNPAHTTRIIRGLPSNAWTSVSPNQVLGATNVITIPNVPGPNTYVMTLPVNPQAYGAIPAEDGTGSGDVIWYFSVQMQSTTQNSPESMVVCKYIVASGGPPPDNTPPTPPTNLTVTPQ